MYKYIIIEYFVSKPLMLIRRALSLFMHIYICPKLLTDEKIEAYTYKIKDFV